jgi:hypothetical protein
MYSGGAITPNRPTCEKRRKGSEIPAILPVMLDFRHVIRYKQGRPGVTLLVAKGRALAPRAPLRTATERRPYLGYNRKKHAVATPTTFANSRPDGVAWREHAFHRH